MTQRDLFEDAVLRIEVVQRQQIEALSLAEATLLRAQDLLRRTRRIVEDYVPVLNNDAGVLLSDINDLLGD
jgi:hypothetical protein